MMMNRTGRTQDRLVIAADGIRYSPKVRPPFWRESSTRHVAIQADWQNGDLSENDSLHWSAPLKDIVPKVIALGTWINAEFQWMRFGVARW